MTEHGERHVWMVWREAAFGDYRTPVHTYGPFDTREQADDFASDNGTVYDALALSFGDREVLGIYD